jgi:hypothetical protein
MIPNARSSLKLLDGQSLVRDVMAIAQSSPSDSDDGRDAVVVTV